MTQHVGLQGGDALEAASGAALEAAKGKVIGGGEYIRDYAVCRLFFVDGSMLEFAWRSDETMVVKFAHKDAYND